MHRHSSCSAQAPQQEVLQTSVKPLYPSLDAVALFIEGLAHTTLPADAEQRRKAAIARYIAELPGKDFFDCRHDWRAFAEGRPVDRNV